MITPAEPPGYLFDVVMNKIQTAARFRAVKNRLIIFSATLIVSVVALVPAIGAIQNDLAQSGFAQFFSLIFSDANLVAANLTNFTLALLESLPAMSFAAFLTAAFILLWSLRNFSRTIKFIKHQSI